MTDSIEINIHKEDLDFCLKRLPKKVFSLMESHKTNLSVGGGFIRSCITGDDLKDIDLFVSSKELGLSITKELAEYYQCKWINTENAFTVLCNKGPVIQLIHRWTYNHPREILSDFDFSICCAVIWADAKDKFTGVAHPMYYKDLAARRIRYLSPQREEAPGGSMLRVLKYYKKGYRITLDSYAKVIARVAYEVRVHDNNADIGEAGFAHVIRGLLFEVDPNSVGESNAFMD